MALGLVRPEMVRDLGSKEVELMIDEGLFMDSPRTVLRLLKSPD